MTYSDKLFDIFRLIKSQTMSGGGLMEHLRLNIIELIFTLSDVYPIGQTRSVHQKFDVVVGYDASCI